MSARPSEVRCRNCGAVLPPDEVAFGSKATGWEHPFGCPDGLDKDSPEVLGLVPQDQGGTMSDLSCLDATPTGGPIGPAGVALSESGA